MKPSSGTHKTLGKAEKDEINDILPHGGSLWPGLDRMAEVSCGIQQLEWALARRAAKERLEKSPEGK